MAYESDSIKSAILNYYGSNSTIWQKIDLGTATAQDISFAFSQIPQRQLSIDRSASGLTLGYGYSDPIYLDKYRNPVLDSFDSNLTTGQYSQSNNIPPRINANFGYDDVTGQYYVESGAKAAGNTLATIADRCSLAVTGINVGAKLGRFIDETIYNSDPDFWDEHLPEINPQTWDNIAGSEAGKSFIRTLFGIKENGDMQTYIDEELLAYYYQLYRDLGLLDDTPNAEGQEITVGTITPEYVTGTVSELASSIGVNLSPTQQHIANTGAVLGKTGGFFGDGVCIIIGNGNVDIQLSDTLDVTATENPNIFNSTPITQTTITVYRPNYITGLLESAGVTTQLITTLINDLNVTVEGLTIFVGELLPNDSSIIPGSTQYSPDPITGTTPQQVSQQLKQNYPDLFTDAITESTLQPDGTIKDKTYVPIPWAIDMEDIDPETKPQTQQKPKTNPRITADMQTNPKISDDVVPKVVDPVVPTPTQPTTDTGTGESPDITPVTGSASSLWAIYNPTQAQVDAFGSWLWSSDFVEQIKKLFVDPMQAIIGIHKVFATPSTGATQNIKCGYLDSQVPSKIVTDQYTTVNCGTVSLYEYFGNVYDYEPYTTIKCFLPFIGIVPLDVSYIMRSKINIKYHVDVLTGACLAEIKVTRDGCKSVIYTYSGSAIVTYPVSSGSYAGVIASVAQTALGIAMGSPTTVLSGVLSAHADTSVNGSFSGSAGAMGCKIPYLIISRPQTRFAEDSEMFSGLGANYTTTIEYCKGYFKVKDVHLHIEGAYDSEISEITALLQNGVLTESEDLIFLEPEESDIEGITITSNGSYIPYGNVRGYNPVIVDVNPVLIEKTIDENGIYLASDDDADGFSKVTVNISGGGGVDLLTQAQWDALTTAEKQSYGLVAIQRSITGFERGILVNGADYIPMGIYLPNSDPLSVICEAYPSIFDSQNNEWGNGTNPIRYTGNITPSLDATENAVLMPTLSDSPNCAYIDLGSNKATYTCYIVMKLINPTSQSRILSSMNVRSSGCGMLLYGSSIYVSSWNNDTSTGVSSSNWFIAAMQYSVQNGGKAKLYGGNFIAKSPSDSSQYLTLNRTDINTSTTYAEPVNSYIKYVAVTNVFEDEATINANLQNLYNVFLQ